MRSIDQIKADIDFARKDIEAFREMKGGTRQAQIGLLEMIKELLNAVCEEIKEENKDGEPKLH